MSATGTPVNTKSLLAFIFNQMRKLDNKEITAQDACAMAKLTQQANNTLDYELKRTVVQIKLAEMYGNVESIKPKLREIESKTFSDELINF